MSAITDLTKSIEFQKAKVMAMEALALANKARVIQRALDAAARGPVGAFKGSALVSAAAAITIITTNTQNTLLQIALQESYKAAILQIEENLIRQPGISEIVKARQEIERLLEQVKAAKEMVRQYRDAARAGSADVLKILRILSL